MELSDIFKDWESLIDRIEKGKKDITKLVPVQKQVTRHGKTFTTTVYVSKEEANASKKPNKKFEDATVPKGKLDVVDIQKHLRPIRKSLGTERYKEYLKACGVTWEPNKESSAADTMRASSAAKKFLEGGGELNEELYNFMKGGGSAEDFKKKQPADTVKPEKKAEPKKKEAPEKKVEPEKKEAPKPEEQPKPMEQSKPVKKDKHQKFLEAVDKYDNPNDVADLVKSVYDIDTVNFKKFSPEMAKLVAKQTSKFLKKFPGTKAMMNVLGGHEEIRDEVHEKITNAFGKANGDYVRKKIRMREGVIAYHSSWKPPKIAVFTNGIYFNNKRYAKSKEAATGERLKYLCETKKWFATGSFEGNIAHEFGHAVHKAHLEAVNPALEKLYNSYTKVEIAKGLSEYGATELAEFIAEGFAEYYTSDNPRPMAKKIGAIFDALAVK